MRRLPRSIRARGERRTPACHHANTTKTRRGGTGARTRLRLRLRRWWPPLRRLPMRPKDPRKTAVLATPKRRYDTRSLAAAAEVDGPVERRSGKLTPQRQKRTGASCKQRRRQPKRHTLSNAGCSKYMSERGHVRHARSSERGGSGGVLLASLAATSSCSVSRSCSDAVASASPSPPPPPGGTLSVPSRTPPPPSRRRHYCRSSSAGELQVTSCLRLWCGVRGRG